MMERTGLNLLKLLCLQKLLCHYIKYRSIICSTLMMIDEWLLIVDPINPVEPN